MIEQAEIKRSEIEDTSGLLEDLFEMIQTRDMLKKIHTKLPSIGKLLGDSNLIRNIKNENAPLSSDIYQESIQAIKDNLVKKEEIQILDELVKNEISKLSEITKKNKGISCQDQLNIIFINVSSKWSVFQINNIVSKDSSLSQTIDFLCSSDLNLLSDFSPFVRYLTKVQSEASCADVMRLLTDRNVGLCENLLKGPSTMDRLHPSLYEYFKELVFEFKKKFKLFSVKVRNNNLLKVCDYLTFLKTVFQDSTTISLAIKTKDAGADGKVSIFQNIQAGKKIFKEIYFFMYNKLQIDPKVPGNEVTTLKVDFDLSLQILSYLLEIGLIEWVDTDKPEEKDEDKKQTQKETIDPNKSEDLNAELDLTAILAFGLHTKIHKLLNSDTSLSFKVISSIKEFRLALDTTNSASEKDICKTILTTLNTQLMRLQLFKKKFDFKEKNLVVLKKHHFKVEFIFNSITNSSLFASPTNKSSSMDLEKYFLMIEMLGFPELLPQFNKKSFQILYMVQVKNSNAQMNFKGFISLLETMINKVIERSPDKETFEVILNQLFINFDKNYHSLDKVANPERTFKNPGNSDQISKEKSFDKMNRGLAGTVQVEAKKKYRLESLRKIKTRVETPERINKKMKPSKLEIELNQSKDGEASTFMILPSQKHSLLQLNTIKNYRGYITPVGGNKPPLKNRRDIKNSKSLSKESSYGHNSNGSNTQLERPAGRKRKSMSQLEGIVITGSLANLPPKSFVLKK